MAHVLVPHEDMIFDDLDSTEKEKVGELTELDIQKNKVNLGNKIINITQLNIRRANENFDQFLLFFLTGQTGLL